MVSKSEEAKIEETIATQTSGEVTEVVNNSEGLSSTTEKVTPKVKVSKSWESNAKLEELANHQRNGEIVTGVIRSVKSMKLPPKMQEESTLIVALPGGITGYCPASEFKERSFRNLEQFVTLQESFVITHLDLPSSIAILSEKQAAEKLREVFWEQLEDLQKNNLLDSVEFNGIITGYNQQKGIIYVHINGEDTYMYRNEWSWRERDVVDAQPGEKITVKVLMFDKEKRAVRVSRKAAIKDPWEIAADMLQVGQVIAGRVTQVHPIHGIYVQIEDGVELKASKVGALDEPSIDDFVSCRLQKLDTKARRGRVIIIGYPRGKRNKKDFGSFLFDE
ncbi:30S ribosomal protein S1 [Psychrobacillus sp. FSL K6-2684]|uniref:30S ribosomal protein S1 n=1 Tax=unclassified Psychrobacillus TaxID=2636677 RepID=UPI0030FBA27E